jgi:hypothetical protein
VGRTAVVDADGSASICHGSVVPGHLLRQEHHRWSQNASSLTKTAQPWEGRGGAGRDREVNGTVIRRPDQLPLWMELLFGVINVDGTASR